MVNDYVITLWDVNQLENQSIINQSYYSAPFFFAVSQLENNFREYHDVNCDIQRSSFKILKIETLRIFINYLQCFSPVNGQSTHFVRNNCIFLAPLEKYF